eukprot:COSAG06_NODE_1307_length_9916_cov_99.462361_2_plen_115_part_00
MCVWPLQIDSCGVAGGVYQWQGAAAAGGDYHPTVNAQRGDLGSKLPRAPSGTVWTAGETVEVAWTHKAWHGGGEPVSLSLSSSRQQCLLTRHHHCRCLHLCCNRLPVQALPGGE